MKLKERPIIFNDTVVRAILAGRKTQTRRVLKRQPFGNVKSAELWPDGLWRIEHEPAPAPIGNYVGLRVRCPCGVIGDRLWVRETWADISFDWEHGTKQEAVYRASHTAYPGPWTPSIFMPHWAARIWLEITDVRVERLQDITPQDIIREGVSLGAILGQPGVSYSDLSDPAVIARFPTLLEISAAVYWDTQNTKRGYSWDDNPLVWVLEFTVL